MKFLSPAIVLIALALALAMRPWRLLGQAALVSPLLASLVITPWLWALPWLQHMPLQLQLSGACLIGLALGWPLAVPVLLEGSFLAIAVSVWTIDTVASCTVACDESLTHTCRSPVI